MSPAPACTDHAQVDAVNQEERRRGGEEERKKLLAGRGLPIY